VSRLFPKVSVIMLTHNNRAFTEACLYGLERFTQYPDWELIIVDNASTDGSVEFLKSYAARQPRVNLILNRENCGFAAGNNLGLNAATGEYLVLLNNDTFPTIGWLRDLIRHLIKDPTIGLIGPVTNNIGNEARIDINYKDMAEMAVAARRYTSAHARQLLSPRVVAFFCAAMPRAVYEKVGPLDETYGLGFFEDDDYCRRIREAGYSVAIADDVFVHHHLSASFQKLGCDQTSELFKRNLAIYEAKWGKWIPHEYRHPVAVGAE
jgi:GT2 family glycosyltransferase